MPNDVLSPEPRLDVLALGQIFLEIAMGTIPRLPGPGEEVFSDAFALSLGGSITIAASAARSGARSGVLADVGDGDWASVIRAYCTHTGIRMVADSRSGPTAVTIILNTDADRSFVSYSPAKFGQGQVERWQRAIVAERPTWAYLRSSEAAVPLLRAAKEAGVRTMLDVDLQSVAHKDRVASELRHADLFVPNEAELRRLTGQPDLASAHRSLRAIYQGPVVTKLGPCGAAVSISGVDTVVVSAGLRAGPSIDATGAGDSFAGALLAALVEGHDLVHAAAHGNEAGSAAVGRLGAVGPLPFGFISRPPRDGQFLAADLPRR
jgi:sugar/nucleoside kinase (ribokinase family)